MDQLSEALWGLLAGALSPEHWPFFAVCLILTVLGQVASTRVFTREQAYLFRGKGRGAWLHGFFWWGRETLPAHPIAAGLVLALLWRDPEGQGWAWIVSAVYWTFCGATSLFAWIAVKAWAKHKGVLLTLPGDSDRPVLPPGPPAR